MSNIWRVKRRAELRALSNFEPERLVALYRFITGMVVTTEFPRWTSFTTMIETILDHEDALHVLPLAGSNRGEFTPPQY